MLSKCFSSEVFLKSFFLLEFIALKLQISKCNLLGKLKQNHAVKVTQGPKSLGLSGVNGTYQGFQDGGPFTARGHYTESQEPQVLSWLPSYSSIGILSIPHFYSLVQTQQHLYFKQCFQNVLREI